MPELSRIGSNSLPGIAQRINAGLRQSLFLAIPTALGYVIIGAIYRGGLFDVDDNWLTYIILATYSLGLLATVSSRLLQNGFMALGDTRTPARMAMVRAAIALMVAIPVMFHSIDCRCHSLRDPERQSFISVQSGWPWAVRWPHGLSGGYWDVY